MSIFFPLTAFNTSLNNGIFNVDLYILLISTTVIIKNTSGRNVIGAVPS